MNSVNGPSLNSIHNNPKLSQNSSSSSSNVHFSDSVQVILSELGIPNQAIASVRSHQGSGSPLVMNGMEMVSQLQVNADTTHLLNQMGLVSSQISLAIAVKGADTLRTLRKKFNDLDDTVSELEKFAELCQALGIEEPSEGLILVTTTGGLAVIEAGITSVQLSH